MLAQTRLLITADDFGYKEDVNDAIVSSIGVSGVRCVSMMMNQPGFAHALSMLRHDRLTGARVGIHVNLTEGYPLTEGIKSSALFCDQQGRFRYGRNQPIFRMGKKDRKAVSAEVEAQICKFIDTGYLPAHIDSHHHVHTEWGILRIFVRLARKYKIARIRIARNSGSAQHTLKNMYRNMVNAYLHRVSGLETTDYFGSIDDIGHLIPLEDLQGKSIEVMVHPMLDAAGHVVDMDQQGLQEKIRQLTKQYPFTM